MYTRENPAMNEIAIDTERYLLFAPDIHVGFGAAVNARFSEDRIRDALGRVCRRHPLLQSTIRVGEDNKAAFVPNTSRPAVPQYIDREPEGDFAADWMQEVNSEPFDFEQGPLLRVLIARGAGKTGVAMLGHHILGDGMSFFWLLRDFLAALDGSLSDEILEPKLISVPGDIPKKMRMGFLSRAFARSLNKKYAKDGKRYTPGDYQSIFKQVRSVRGPAAEFFRLGVQETEQLVKACKEHSLTVNSGITAAFWAARYRNGLSSRYTGISTNVRGDLLRDPGESLGNFISGLLLTTPVDPDVGFWENAIALHKEFLTQRSDPKKRVSAPAFLHCLSDDIKDGINFYPFEENPHPVFRTLEPLLVGEHFRGLGISNLGLRELPFRSFSVSDVWFAPPLFGTGDVIVGIITACGRMTLCVRYGEKEIPKETIRKVTGDALALLLQ